MKIVSAEQMRRLEQAAFASGASEDALQARAGAAVADEILRLPRGGGVSVILVGRGNNGRDGYVAGRCLVRAGRPVVLVLLPGHTVTAHELAVLKQAGGAIFSAEDLSQTTAQADLHDLLSRADVVVDGLVGLGAHGPLREPLASVANTVNAAAQARKAHLPVVAIDIPSGIDPDTGAVPGAAVRCTHTVTLGAVKQGLLLFPGASCVGQLIRRSIGLPPEAGADLPFTVLDASAAAALLPQRPQDAHKYGFGRVLVVAGSDQFPGAALLCSGAAARSGAGLVTLAASSELRSVSASRRPEITYTAFARPTTDGIAALESLADSLEAAAAVVVGPGLGRHPGTVAFVHGLVRLWRERALPTASVVLDADALFALSQQPGWWEALDHRVILTPHAGELARLCADPAAKADLEGDGEDDAARTPWEAARRLSARWGCTLVYKGPITCVSSPRDGCWVWCWPNSALATGGTGDVLAGLVGGLAAQGLAPARAAQVGVAVHARAARIIQSQKGWGTLLAGDLLDGIPVALAELQQL